MFNRINKKDTKKLKQRIGNQMQIIKGDKIMKQKNEFNAILR